MAFLTSVFALRRGAMTLARCVPPRGWIALVILVALIVAGLWILAWGERRYAAGEAAADARWEAAAERLEDRARNAADKADAAEADRIRNHQAAVAEEKEKIDEAVAAGRSPLDVLFGGL